MKACRHFKGDRPCKYYWIDRSWNCFECEHHNPYNERILLIKLDALGDVVRATALAEGIKKKYPNCQLSWLTVKDALYFVESTPFVDRTPPAPPLPTVIVYVPFPWAGIVSGLGRG